MKPVEIIPGQIYQDAVFNNTYAVDIVEGNKVWYTLNEVYIDQTDINTFEERVIDGILTLVEGDTVR